MVTLADTRLNLSASRRKRFHKAQSALKKAVNCLIKRYHAKKIILIGSLMDKDRFGVHSDIDLCVEGLSAALYFKAVGEILSTSDDFEIDIIPLEDATPEMKTQAEKGMVLYEKR